MKISISNYQNPQNNKLKQSQNFKGAYLISGKHEAHKEFLKLINNTVNQYGEVVFSQPITRIFPDDNAFYKVLCTTGKEREAVYNYIGNVGCNSREEYMTRYINALTKPKILEKYYTALEKGDKNTTLNMIIDAMERGKKALSAIFGKEAENIKTIKAEDAINAINNNNFNFMTGEISK